MENRLFALIIAVVILVVTWCIFYIPRYIKRAEQNMYEGMSYRFAGAEAHNNLILWTIISWIAGIAAAAIFWNLFVTN